MIAFERGLLIVLIYICAYSLINRICKCIERCRYSEVAKVYSNPVAEEIEHETSRKKTNSEE